MTQPADRHPDPHQFPDYPGQQPHSRPAYDLRWANPDPNLHPPRRALTRNPAGSGLSPSLPSPSSSLSNCKSAKRFGMSIEVNAT